MTSPDVTAAEQRTEFLRHYRLACSCALELRQERTGFQCARCEAPLVRVVSERKLG